MEYQTRAQENKLGFRDALSGNNALKHDIKPKGNSKHASISHRYTRR